MKHDLLVYWKDISRYRSVIMGISIVGILWCHLAECLNMHNVNVYPAAKVLEYATCFVDVFMLLSGIGLCYSFSANNDIKTYFKKRIFRLVPTYMILTLPYWIYRDVWIDGGGIREVVADLFFFSFFNEGMKRYWFVAAILLMYLLFPLIFNVLKRFRVWGGLVSIVLVLGVSVLGNMCVPKLLSNINIMILRIPAFILGVWFGFKCKTEEPVPRQTILVSIIGCCLFLYLRRLDVDSFFHYFFYYISCALLGLVSLFVLIIVIKYAENVCEGLMINKFLKMIGGMTLEIYLFHSMLKNLKNYPETFFSYLLWAVVMPIVCAIIFNKLKALLKIKH